MLWRVGGTRRCGPWGMVREAEVALGIQGGRRRRQDGEPGIWVSQTLAGLESRPREGIVSVRCGTGRRVAGLLAATGVAVAFNLAATPLHQDRASEYPVWKVLNSFMAAGVMAVLATVFLHRHTERNGRPHPPLEPLATAAEPGAGPVTPPEQSPAPQQRQRLAAVAPSRLFRPPTSDTSNHTGRSP